MTPSSLSGLAFHRASGAIGVLSTFALLATIATAQEQDSKLAPKPAPTFANVPYGSHERHVLDFWKAESDIPTPVVIFIHGGGFTGGTKEAVKEEMRNDLLTAKISVAAIHYRLLGDAPLPAAHDDAVRALQFLRSKATAWNIDKTRIGAYGSSAGAQLCMYLAFNEDRAEPESTDPLARESSRLTCVATLRGQTTMNTELWLKWIPGYDAPHRDPYSIFGVKTKTEYLKKVSEVSALDLVSADDPPIYMKYKMAPGDPIPENPKKVQGWKVHHVIFGVKLKEKMHALGIEVDLDYPGAKTTYESMSHFFISKLSKSVADKTENGFSFSKRESELDILLDGKPLATYVWSDPKTTRPYFKQIKAAGGEVQLTRNHPPQEGDFDDHETYHPGIWWGFGDVGGNDYWRMKARIIGGQFTQEPTTEGSSASFAVKNKLLTNQGDETFCQQNCRYTFLRREHGVLMICESALVRDASDFWLGDQEEMGLAFSRCDLTDHKKRRHDSR